MSGTGPLVLGIETSCDDTAVALVDQDGAVVSACVASQAALHSNYGGVYPELASRAHIDKILPTVGKVMDDAAISPGDLKAIGVTRGPGLIGSLMVGLNTACGLGHGWGVPVVGVNHLRGHLRSADLEEKRVSYPAMVLLVSGGHTLLARMSGPGEISLIGSTLD
ncbi:MAG TPA: tRNA (adenosine(37)-N6)-threonylcarbamoyltransferase complex transferase subunit TsaD, partial [Streptosporangiaceae bacterium]